MEKVGIRSARSPSGRDVEFESPAAKPAVVPVFGILAATVFAFLAFLPSQSPSAEQVSLKLNSLINALTAVAQAFYWLSSMTAAAAMLSWIGMMVTYSESLFVSCALPFSITIGQVRWHAGIKHAEAQDPDNFKNDHPELYNRSVLQPFVSLFRSADVLNRLI
jgi:amino acid transporter